MPTIQTTNYVGSLYLTEEQANFDGNQAYYVSPNLIYTNFTYEFDAIPSRAITIFQAGTQADYLNNSNIFNYVIVDAHGSLTDREDDAGVGLSLGTNGAVVIAHTGGYYYVLLSYTGDLSSQHTYKFKVTNNIPSLYIDGTLVATGIKPTSPITQLFTVGQIGNGHYGNYQGWANNFVLYNNAR